MRNQLKDPGHSVARVAFLTQNWIDPVVAIDEEVFGRAGMKSCEGGSGGLGSWGFRVLLTQQMVSGYVAVVKDDVTGHDEAAGYLIKRLSYRTGCRGYIEVMRLCVHPDWCRVGVGSMLVRHVMTTGCMSPAAAALGGARECVRMVVGERRLGMQLFLKSLGWKAAAVVSRGEAERRKWHGWESQWHEDFDRGDDFYLMEWRRGDARSE